MQFPPYLKDGDKVAVVSPAGKIDRGVVLRAIQLLQEQGFIVDVGKNVFGDDGIYAGNDLERASDMQKAISDKNIKAIFFSRGGYGSLRTHQFLNWSAFFKKPKWLVGFSDITVFHSYLSVHKTASVHGVMPAFFEQEGSVTDSFIRTISLLRGQIPNYSIDPHPMNRLGTAEGILTGGNLSVLISIRGTSLDISPRGKILFIEDVSEYLYHLDRMMTNLKMGHVLEKLSGLIVGSFTCMKDGEIPYGKSAEEIIRKAVENYNYPVIFGFPAGHKLPNLPLLMGSRVVLDVSSAQAEIKTIH